MTTVMRKCKVCGAEYEYCHTFKRPIPGAFRWQDVACCPEHGAEYLAEVISSRDELNKFVESPIEEDIDDEEYDEFESDYNED